MFTMADGIASDVSALPGNLPAYASYVDGYGGFAEIVARFPGAAHLSISVNGNRARCGDFENGALQNYQAPWWLDNLADPDPILYTFASNMQGLIDAAGNRKFKRWSAHVGQGPHICGPSTCGYPQADATQYYFGGSYDLSLCNDNFLSIVPVPPPIPEDQNMIAAAVNADGRIEVFVESADGSIWHTFQNKGGGWDGGKPGIREALLTPLAPKAGSR